MALFKSVPLLSSAATMFISVFVSIWLKVTCHNIDNVALCTKSNRAAAQRRLLLAHNMACVATCLLFTMIFPDANRAAERILRAETQLQETIETGIFECTRFCEHRPVCRIFDQSSASSRRSAKSEPSGIRIFVFCDTSQIHPVDSEHLQRRCWTPGGIFVDKLTFFLWVPQYRALDQILLCRLPFKANGIPSASNSVDMFSCRPSSRIEPVCAISKARPATGLFRQ